MPSLALAATNVKVSDDEVIVLPAAWSVAVLVPPVPDSGTVSVLFVAVLVNVRLPVRVPAAVGVKVTVAVHVLPAPSVVPQVVVRLKSPLAVTPVIVADAPPVLVNVTLWVALDEPTAVAP